MKKIRLITCLSTIGALAVAAPIMTTAWTTVNANRELNYALAKPNVSTYQASLINKPLIIYTNNGSYSFTLVLKNITRGCYVDVEKWVIIDDETISCLNATIEGNTLTVTPTREATNKDNKIKLVAYSTDSLYAIHTTINLDNIVASKNWFTFNGTQYALADDIDPNLFIAIDSTHLWEHVQTIPLKNNKTMNIGGHYGYWNKLTTLNLESCNPNITSIDNDFLNECTGLVTVNLSGLTSVTKIGNHFLYKNTSLKHVTVPQKSATKCSIVLDDTFMYDFPKDGVIECGKYLYSYQNTAPWKVWAEKMVGEHSYGITCDDWNPFKPRINRTSECKLHLFDGGAEVPFKDNVTYKIEDASTCLDAKIENEILKITPTSDALNKSNTVVIGAYINGEKVWEENKVIENIAEFSNTMTFKGVEYELADDIDPNLFVTWDFWSIDGWRKAVIPLLGGGTVTIGATFVEWNNLKQLKLVSCSPVSEIEEFFLSNCRVLTSLDLTGLHGFREMGESFVSNCESLENIILPQQDPRQITKVVAVRFLLGLPTDAVIHCGDYLEEYKSTSPWNEWANQMVK